MSYTTWTCQAGLVNQVALITQSSTELALTGYINWVNNINLHYCVYNWSPVISFFFLLVQYWWNRWGLQFLSRFVTFSRLCFPYLFLVMIWRADLKFLCIFMRCSSPIYTIFKRETEIKLARRILNYNVYECTLSSKFLECKILHLIPLHVKLFFVWSS